MEIDAPIQESLDSLSKLQQNEMFCEFLEVAIHTILYARKIYPDGKKNN